MQKQFTFIVDTSRGETITTLENMDRTLKTKLSEFGLYVSLMELTGIRELQFPGGTKQWRKDYIVKKNGRSVTWNEIYAAINSIYAPVYKDVK